MRAVEIVSALNQRERRQERLKHAPVFDMELHAAACLLFEFVKGGLKAAGAKRDAGQFVF